MKQPTHRSIFILDALGAALSGLFLLIPYSFEELFGMPKCVITNLFAIAACLFAYSLTMYFTKPANWKPFLRVVAILNLCYCLYTLYQIVQNSDLITVYGYVYFIGEIFIIVAISTYELLFASKATSH